MIMYRELEDYIYEYCKEYMTQDEFMAHKVLLYKTPNTSEAMIARMREQEWFNDEPHILAMLADGFPEFKRRVVERIWREHKDVLPLNLCPKCNLIARTPLARQCRFCKHDWHSGDTAAK